MKAAGASAKLDLLAMLLKAVYYLQLVEIVGLCGISFVHNREHYRKSTEAKPASEYIIVLWNSWANLLPFWSLKVGGILK